jgi:hypothetical protein
MYLDLADAKTNFKDLDERVRQLEKEVKSLRGLVFLGMKKKK